MKRRKREEIHYQSSSKNDVNQHVKDGVLIVTSKGMADYDSLKAKELTENAKVTDFFVKCIHDDFS